MGVKIPKLQGSKDYDIWILLIEATLADKGICNQLSGLAEAIKKDASNDSKTLGLIRLNLGNGPLINTKFCTDAVHILEQLQSLYRPKGFSSDYLICQEFFNTSIQQANGSIETYLSRINRLTNEMAARNLALPNRVVAAFTLNGLSKEYGHVVSAITQSMRTLPYDKENNKEATINLPDLYSQLLDESRRIFANNKPSRSAHYTLNIQNTQHHQKAIPGDDDTEMAMHTKTELYCYHCK
jgi:hypothetical protein